MIKHNHKPGDLVRVARAYYHGLKFGAVCRVVGTLDNGDLSVFGPVSWRSKSKVVFANQSVEGSLCTPAKQATKKVGK